MNNTFATTHSYLDTAVQRAETLAKQFNARTAPAPFTNVAELVKLLTILCP